VKNEIRDIFVNELGISADEYSESLVYDSIPEWGSASHMIIILALEEKFGIQLDTDEVVSMTTIPKIYSVLQSKGVAT
jgi:acyl carrier protein